MKELCKHQDDPARKEYLHYHHTPIAGPEQETLVVNLRVLAGALHGDPVWASSVPERNPETFKATKYLRAKGDVQASKPIYMPWLIFGKGRTRLMDGRHRLYALIDQEYTHVRVVFQPEIAAIVRTLADPEDCRCV